MHERKRRVGQLLLSHDCRFSAALEALPWPYQGKMSLLRLKIIDLAVDRIRVMRRALDSRHVANVSPRSYCMEMWRDMLALLHGFRGNSKEHIRRVGNLGKLKIVIRVRELFFGVEFAAALCMRWAVGLADRSPTLRDSHSVS